MSKLLKKLNIPNIFRYFRKKNIFIVTLELHLQWYWNLKEMFQNVFFVDFGQIMYVYKYLVFNIALYIVQTTCVFSECARLFRISIFRRWVDLTHVKK